jgi:uncharacterized protein HemY
MEGGILYMVVVVLVYVIIRSFCSIPTRPQIFSVGQTAQLMMPKNIIAIPTRQYMAIQIVK